MEKLHFFGYYLGRHIIASVSRVCIYPKKRFVKVCPRTFCPLGTFYGPGIDKVQEAVEGEFEGIDPLPRTRPVDLCPVLVGDPDEAADCSVGKSVQSFMTS